ncbi:hypothetical protein [Aliiruegeria sabulilitoris]|uniref:hypothetical protein n=1 Tax=Aliiruegeria sabulilitoris TaxID=1510458 RepID=UPI0008343948|nr:hypothetical protein [Aliiruegeria sabulilitoris]NDR59730.1 hypothetical protein [Pseudoruegeria sp. M32A2M]
MGLAFETGLPGYKLTARRSDRFFPSAAALIRDGLLVAGTASAFAGGAILRYGWDAMTDSGRTVRMLIEFSAFYMFLAFALASLWMCGRFLAGYGSTPEKTWMHGFLASIMLLLVAIALVPPIWD